MLRHMEALQEEVTSPQHQVAPDPVGCQQEVPVRRPDGRPGPSLHEDDPKMDIYLYVFTHCNFFQFVKFHLNFGGGGFEEECDTNQTCPLATCCVTQPRPVLFVSYTLRNIQIDQYLTPSIVISIRGAIAGRAWAECSVQCRAFYQQFSSDSVTMISKE